jgi:hypothetical protein
MASTSANWLRYRRPGLASLPEWSVTRAIIVLPQIRTAPSTMSGLICAWHSSRKRFAVSRLPYE